MLCHTSIIYLMYNLCIFIAGPESLVFVLTSAPPLPVSPSACRLKLKLPREVVGSGEYFPKRVYAVHGLHGRPTRTSPGRQFALLGTQVRGDGATRGDGSYVGINNRLLFLSFMSAHRLPRIIRPQYQRHPIWYQFHPVCFRTPPFVCHDHPLCSGGAYCKGSRIIGFVDGTLRGCTRQRGQDDLQRENYSGKHKAHGLSVQSVVFPNGMIGHLGGMESGRRHDYFLLRVSGLNDTLALVQQGKEFQGRIYGDAAYPLQAHIYRGYIGNLTPAQKKYNQELSRVRVCVEWVFGQIIDLFPFVDFKNNLQLMFSPI